MKYLLISVVFITSCFSKVYDCFIFFNELDILRIRLEELNDHVDHFVLVEAQDTFSGKEKSLYFQENKYLFEKYQDKIIHIIIEKTPEFGPDPWPRERFQRNQIMRALKKCKKEDIILISDVDEIVRGEQLPELIDCLRRKTYPIIGCGCDFYRFFLNRKDETKWTGTAITNYKTIKKLRPQGVRDLREKFYVSDKTGWHFSNMGGYQKYLQKISSFSHYRECSFILNQSKEEIYNCLKSFLLVEIDESFPKYIRENYDELAEKNFFDPGFYQ